MKISEVLLTCSQALLEAVNFSQVIYPLPGGNQRTYGACTLKSGKPANGIRITGVCGQAGGGGADSLLKCTFLAPPTPMK